jgi:hypothetical protein
MLDLMIKAAESIVGDLPFSHSATSNFRLLVLLNSSRSLSCDDKALELNTSELLRQIHVTIIQMIKRIASIYLTYALLIHLGVVIFM